jgi:glycosyltransferase involved in cell wall biosynthesis
MPANHGPEVTAVIPTHNRWHLLPSALESARGQADVAVEVIVVDDGSRDPQEAPAVDGESVRLLRHDRPRGVAEARNAGLAAARGKWVAFLDDDDVWAPTYLQTLVRLARAEDASFAYSGVVEVNERFEVLRIPVTPEPEELPELLPRHNAVPAAASNTFARTDVMRRLGGFDPRLLVLEDWDLWIRLALSGPGAMTAEPLVGHVIHSGSIQIVDVEKLMPAFEYLASKHRASPRSRGSEPHGLAFSRYVAGCMWRAGRKRGAARALVRGFLRYGGLRALRRAARALLRGDVARQRRKAEAHAIPEPSWLVLYR